MRDCAINFASILPASRRRLICRLGVAYQLIAHARLTRILRACGCCGDGARGDRSNDFGAVDQAPYATFDTTDQVVRLSNTGEPIQYTVVPQTVPVGVPVYGAPVGVQFGEPWSWQLLPEGLIYRSYLAGVREPRLGIVPFYEFDRDAWLIDATIGARVGLLRYGNEADTRPEGFQLDLETAAFPRLDPDAEMDLVATDFRVGVPLTWGNELYQVKLAYYHLSSHIADEFLLVNPAFPRLNFSRDAIVLGNSVYATRDLRFYAEVGYAYYTDGGSEPWEFQFGIDYSPLFAQGRAGRRSSRSMATCGRKSTSAATLSRRQAGNGAAGSPSGCCGWECTT